MELCCEIVTGRCDSSANYAEIRWPCIPSNRISTPRKSLCENCRGRASRGPETYQERWKTILAGNVYRSILVNRKKNGELYYMEESICPVRDTDGQITHFIANGRDLTEQLRQEAQLLQSQKRDAIGNLAGGVAPDFNNLLTIITSYAELALDAVPRDSPLESKIQEILLAARRGRLS